MFSCNQGKGCYMNQSSNCYEATESNCCDQLDDAIDVIQSIYDLANDYLSDIEDDGAASDCGCGCKADYNDCGCKSKYSNNDYNSGCNDCGCKPKYFDRDYKYDYDDCGCKSKYYDDDYKHSYNDYGCKSKYYDDDYKYDDDYYDDCKEPYRYWGRKGCYVQKQDCNNYLPRKDKKPCRRRRGRCW